MSLNATPTLILNTSSNGDSTTSLGNLLQHLTTLWHNLKPLRLIPSLLPGRRGQPPSHYHLLLGSSREWLGFPFSRPNNPSSLSCSPPKTCTPDPSPASLPFFGHAPAPQCLSHSEGFTTKHPSLTGSRAIIEITGLKNWNNRSDL